MAAETPVPPRRIVGVESFADFDLYAAGIRSEGVEMTLVGHESGPWRVAFARLVRSAVQFGTEGGANVGHSRIPGHMTVFHVALAGVPPLCEGRELGPRRLVVSGPGAHAFEAVRGPGEWATYSASTDLVEATRAAIGHGRPVTPGERAVLVTTRVADSAVRRLLSRLRRQVLTTPDAFESRDFRAAVERELVDAFVGALATGRPPGRRRDAVTARRHAILVRAMEFLGATRHQAVQVPELCRAVGTSPRTLTRVFRETFRLSPVRYLKLRRLNQVRAWLRRGEPAPASVMEAAARFDFRVLGRFAGEYRRFFGETPSNTLRARRRR